MKQLFLFVVLCSLALIGCANEVAPVGFSTVSLDAAGQAIVQLECDNQFVGSCGILYHDDVADCVADVTSWVENDIPVVCQSLTLAFLDCENEDPCWEFTDPAVCDVERQDFLQCLRENP